MKISEIKNKTIKMFAVLNMESTNREKHVDLTEENKLIESFVFAKCENPKNLNKKQKLIFWLCVEEGKEEKAIKLITE